MPRHLGFSDSVNLTISLCLTYVLCVSCIRIWIRKGAFGIDDAVIAIATLVSFGHTAADYVALANGLGKPWNDIISNENLSALNAATISGIVTWIVALYLSKCAMISFLSRITKTHSQLALYKISNALTAVFGIISLLAMTVDCPSSSGYYWAFNSNRRMSCPNQSTRWQVVTALDVVTEVVLLILPVHLVAGLQMRAAKKAVIIAAFYLRLPVIGLSIARNYYTLQLRLPKTNVGLESGLVVIWLEVELAYALAAGTLSSSKAFTESFNSSFGLGFARGKGDETYGLSGTSAKTPATSNDEKSRNDSALESGIEVSRPRSFPTVAVTKMERHSLNPIITPVPPNTARGSLHVSEHLKLRPDVEKNSYTYVAAATGSEDRGVDSCNNSDKSANDMVIRRDQGYEIKNDKAPFIRMRSYYSD